MYNVTGNHTKSDQTVDCGCSETCTNAVLDSPAGGYTCGMRINWLMTNGGKSEREACVKVGKFEFPSICYGCDPTKCPKEAVFLPEKEITCPPCDLKICTNHLLNRCPLLDAPYLCTEGTSMGGCSMIPWRLGLEGGMSCSSCCLLTVECDKVTGLGSNNSTQSSLKSAEHKQDKVTDLGSNNSTQSSLKSTEHKQGEESNK